MFRYENHVSKPHSLVQPHLPLLPLSNFFKILFIDVERERERENTHKKEKHQFVVPLMYAFIGYFLYVPGLDIKPCNLIISE